MLGGGLREQNIVGAGSCFAYRPTPCRGAGGGDPGELRHGVVRSPRPGEASARRDRVDHRCGRRHRTACIQLALAAGAVPIAIVGGEQKAALVRSLGVEHIVDHRETPDWVDTVREMSGGGVDVAWDAVGGDAFHQVRRCMAWDGRLLIVGFVGGIAQAPTNHALLKNYSIVGVHWGASLMRDPESVKRQMAPSSSWPPTAGGAARRVGAPIRGGCGRDPGDRRPSGHRQGGGHDLRPAESETVDVSFLLNR